MVDLCMSDTILMDRRIMGDDDDKREYLSALEQERRKIETFQRELPLSLQIVNETIETLRKQMEEQQQQQKAVHVEEFTTPINLNISYSEDDGLEQDGKSDKNEKDWSSSLRLWSQESDKDISTTDKRTEETASLDNNRCASEEGFSNGQEDDQNRTESKENDKEKKSDQEQKCEAQKKTRRSWSQDLHRRFVNALEQLGGPHVATPKHIRELMKVDGLTNDEVKSHLQKYRLHTKKPSSRVRGSSSHDYTPRAPQFVLVGAWVPPADCSGSEDSGGATNIIHSSLVSLPSHLILPHQNRSKTSHGSPNSPLEKCPTRDRTAKSASSQTTNASL